MNASLINHFLSKPVKGKLKPLFSFDNSKPKNFWDCQNDSLCSLLYGRPLKELPRDLRSTVKRLMNTRNRRRDREMEALMKIGDELSKRHVAARLKTPYQAI